MQRGQQTFHDPCTAMQEATLTLQAADLTMERDRLEKQLSQAKAAAQATADQHWKLTRQAEVRRFTGSMLSVACDAGDALLVILRRLYRRHGASCPMIQ